MSGCEALITPVAASDEDFSLGRVTASQIYLVPARPEDDAFLYATYASTRAKELALTGWAPDQKEQFLHMQYDAQRRSYAIQLPHAEYSLILCGETPVGRLILDQTPEEIHIVDVALLTQFRRQGIGAILMERIMNEAAQTQRTVRLHVEQFNPALPWYQKLGFLTVSHGPVYAEMVWRPHSIAEVELQVGAGNAGTSD
jgi:ribosomal protein S18 acetylase RimI-like enzyme